MVWMAFGEASNEVTKRTATATSNIISYLKNIKSSTNEIEFKMNQNVYIYLIQHFIESEFLVDNYGRVEDESDSNELSIASIYTCWQKNWIHRDE